MSEGRSDYFKLKNILTQEIYGEVDARYILLEQLGLRDTRKKKFQKMTFKYAAVNEIEKNKIQICDSIHTMGVQRSNYLQVDSATMADLHHNPHKIRAMTANMKSTIKKKKGVNDDPEEQIFNQVYLKYCKPDEIKMKH